jgi:Icc-related predicted phosphoesterase
MSDHHTDAATLERRLHRVVNAPDLIVLTGDMVKHFTALPWLEPYEGFLQQDEWERMIAMIRSKWSKAEIVTVAGNHDFFLNGFVDGIHAFDKTEPELKHVLGLKIAGFSGIPELMGRWRDEIDPRHNKALYQMLADVAHDADILVTHAGPCRMLDRVHSGKHVGFKGMLKVMDTKLKNLSHHLFGHIHEDNGIEERNRVVYSNAATTIHEFDIKT